MSYSNIRVDKKAALWILSIGLFLILSSNVAHAQWQQVINPTVPPVQVRDALVSMGWHVYHADKISKKVPMIFDKDLVARTGNMAGYYDWGCPQGGVVMGIIPADWVPAIEHEYHHAWDGRDCTIDNLNKHLRDIKTDIKKVPMFEAVHAYKNSYNDIYHINHWFIDSLKHDYVRMPEWYRVKYFGYTLPPVVNLIYLPGIFKNMVYAVHHSSN